MSSRNHAALRCLILCLGLTGLLSCTEAPHFDVLIRGGTVYDGSGEPPIVADVAINGKEIVAVGDVGVGATATTDIDASGLAVAPGFINMLSWATDSLIEDPRGQSDIRQGVTLEIFGEGMSMGPVNEEMKNMWRARQGDIKYEIEWTTLGEYLDHLVERGVSPNVASFVGATTVRVHELGYEDRAPTEEELDRMRELVDVAMREGALGVGSSLIYAPASYSETEELIELAKVASKHGGMYISHMRSEGDRIEEAIEELITIAREADLPSEIYHLKMAGQDNWEKIDWVIDRVEQARSEGLKITADMYSYTAGATGLDAAMPRWVQEGGYEAWAERLRDPEIRARVESEMTQQQDEWENLFLAAGAEGTLLVGFKNDDLKHLTGRTLADVAAERGTTPAQTAMDLVVEDGSRVGTIYFLMSEENVLRQAALPWVSFCSDSGAPATEGVFLRSNPHPRAYGSFARVLGKFVREEGVMPLEAAVRKLAALPAENLGLTDRGRLGEGFRADVAIFDPDEIRDNATYAEPHQYATGMVHVFVNGVQVLADGEHTGETPGEVVRGAGWTGGEVADSDGAP